MITFKASFFASSLLMLTLLSTGVGGLDPSAPDSTARGF